MMVIRRKCGQAFHIGDDVRISVQEIQNGTHVRFGIEAPVDIPVHRLEIYERIQQENRASSSGNALEWLNGATS
ncbi:MAG: carbon storage regulator [Mariprofundaceae bacterium]